MVINRFRLILRNLFFFLLHPGLVAFLIPYLIAGENLFVGIAGPILFHHFLGVLIFIAGILILLLCIWRFIIEGMGTLSPLDPTRRLVTTGLYRFSRNPMYLGVIMILLGEYVLTLNGFLFLYTLGIFILFHFFIKFWEEPRLSRDFGTTYDTYKSQTRRWI